MVQFQKPKKVYNDRRVYPGGGIALAPGDGFIPMPTASASAGIHEKRVGRGKVDGRGGLYMPFGPMGNGGHKHAGAPFPMPRIPLSAFPGAPLTQPYAISSRGGVHGPIGGVPQGPQAGSRGFGVGRGSTGGPIGGHLSHHQPSQPLGNLGSGFGFGGMENASSQPSVGGPLSQSGLLTQMPSQGLSQNLRDGFSLGGMSQDFLGDDFKSQGSHVAYTVADFSTQASQSGYGVEYATQGTQGSFNVDFLNPNSQSGYSHTSPGNDFSSQDYISHGSQGLFTQVGYTDRAQDEPASQAHFGLGGPLHSQGLMNPIYSQPFTQYTQPFNQQTQQQTQHQRMQYNG